MGILLILVSDKCKSSNKIGLNEMKKLLDTSRKLEFVSLKTCFNIRLNKFVEDHMTAKEPFRAGPATWL